MLGSAAFLARVRFGYPAKAVAAALGYRDASGVSHAIKRMEFRPEDLRSALASIERRLE